MTAGGDKLGSETLVPCPDRGGVRGRRLLGRVAVNEVFGSMVRLSLDVAGWVGAVPGQFALLQPEPSRCFLARPLSVCEQVGERVCFLVAPVGAGTQELSSLEPGRTVWVTGPLGNGFPVDVLAMDGGRTVIVAGGVGAAPFPLLVDRLAAAAAKGAEEPGIGRASGSGGPRAPEVLVLLGFRDHDQSRGAEPLREAVARATEAGLPCRLEMVSEDGSCGPAARVTDLLERHLRPGDRLAVCGPEAMAAAVRRLCGRTQDVRAWYSLETSMACGVGSCHGCVVRLANGSYARVCHDGPVFTGEEICGG